ncbi:hypothetical protein PJ985_13600 [Streptomyces sp. ACA25]|uniref:hypothetical protein n=1 Tax=Streptomyces sp. ACA25 TaxID=3022596 RepID=UPI002307410E|nr:hypothetical protein [Streptomyces sp. ACA25]MDB1088602.1 hypothetical protein [Streptomyces sp. ACA25]
MRRTVVVPLMTAAVLLAATGCGEEAVVEQPPGSEAEPEVPDETPGGETPDASPERFEDRAGEIAEEWPDVDPITEGSEDLRPLQGAAEPDSSDSVVTVTVGHSDCAADFGAWLEETPDLVILAGWEKEDPDVEFCNEMLVLDEVEVELSEALGDRTLVDAATGQDLLGEDYPSLP